MKQLLCVLAVVAVMAGQALAGGGGSKANATIKVTNNGTAAWGGAVGAVVIVDPPGGLAYAPATFDQIVTDGGKQVNFGATQSFKVQAGAHVVWAIFGTGPPVPAAVGAPSRPIVYRGKEQDSQHITNGWSRPHPVIVGQ